MASHLTGSEFQIGNTQVVSSIATTMSNSNSEIPTSAAVIKYMISQGLLPKVGGIVYYINTNSTNTYTFYNSSGTVVSAPSVGSDYTNYYYTKSGSGVDKFYIYNQNAMFQMDKSGTELNPYVAWTYLGAGNQSFIDNASYTSGLPSGKQEYQYYGGYGRVYETLNGTYTGTAIGTGKSNTQNMMSLRGGVYIQGPNRTASGGTVYNYSETIWSICNLFNKGLYNINGSSVTNSTGCSDWYVPSKDELETMKNAIGAKAFATMLFPGSASYVSYAIITPWSSSAYTNINQSWSWYWANGNDGGMTNTNRSSGNNKTCLALSRSF